MHGKPLCNIELVSIPATHEPRAAAYQFGHRFSSSAIEVACPRGSKDFLLLPQKCLLLSSCSHLLCCSNKWIFCNKKEQQIQDLRNFSTMSFDLLAISSIIVLEFFSHTGYLDKKVNSLWKTLDISELEKTPLSSSCLDFVLKLSVASFPYAAISRTLCCNWFQQIYSPSVNSFVCK